MESNHIKKNQVKSPNWVGAFVRQKREAKGLSQKELGQKFEPPVTTQFVSNLERGITPIPATHIQSLIRALEMNEHELMMLMEKEYAAKLTSKIAGAPAEGDHSAPAVMVVPRQDEEFFKWFLQSYHQLSDIDRAHLKDQLRNWIAITVKKAV